ncbi:uncharacterized protein LOC113238638 [Hyposmocoma kahamanoa]|uniref:uncharacterized protein LOC113238638 n=1 Tax=Hyposmocoma kahamanoa TaxID=1477025 RepID=UPI000E6D74F4|nr:uncharacterized protein LOC113238638 [Hyposmocoma kahamanoa]
MPACHHTILQGNLKHCSKAQDLLVQAMAEWGVEVAAVAEPCLAPRGGTGEATVAIVASPAGNSSPLAVKAQFQAFLETLERAVRAAPTPVLVMGDLNAKSAAWGSPVTNARGPELEDWAAALGGQSWTSRLRPPH